MAIFEIATNGIWWKIFSWNWFIWFHEFFGLDFFKFSSPRCELPTIAIFVCLSRVSLYWIDSKRLTKNEFVMLVIQQRKWWQHSTYLHIYYTTIVRLLWEWHSGTGYLLIESGTSISIRKLEKIKFQNLIKSIMRRTK